MDIAHEVRQEEKGLGQVVCMHMRCNQTGEIKMNGGVDVQSIS
jgi:hypothetical protein